MNTLDDLKLLVDIPSTVKDGDKTMPVSAMQAAEAARAVALTNPQVVGLVFDGVAARFNPTDDAAAIVRKLADARRYSKGLHR